MSSDQYNGKSLFFTKVIIHGIISDYSIKEFKNKRQSIKLSIHVKRDQKRETEYKVYEQYNIDVYVEKSRLILSQREWLSIGNHILVEGKITLLFIRNNDKVIKKTQYIFIENILSSRGSGFKGETDSTEQTDISTNIDDKEQ